MFGAKPIDKAIDIYREAQQKLVLNYKQISIGPVKEDDITVITNAFDVILQAVLFNACIKDGDFSRAEKKFLKAISRNADLWDYIRHVSKGEINADWSMLTACNSELLNTMTKLIKHYLDDSADTLFYTIFSGQGKRTTTVKEREEIIGSVISYISQIVEYLGEAVGKREIQDEGAKEMISALFRPTMKYLL